VQCYTSGWFLLGDLPHQLMATRRDSAAVSRIPGTRRDFTMAEIAIVGGGPSGAMCGEQLARAGHKVAIFDEHLAWEKPCGGGLTHKAIQCFPFLLENSYPKKLVHSVDLISSEEHHATLEMPHPIVIYSRTVLNGMLLDRARDAGCNVQRSHVMSVDTTTTKPR